MVSVYVEGTGEAVVIRENGVSIELSIPEAGRLADKLYRILAALQPKKQPEVQEAEPEPEVQEAEPEPEPVGPVPGSAGGPGPVVSKTGYRPPVNKDNSVLRRIVQRKG